MKKTTWNLILALAVFVLWGNAVSLFLPVEDFGAVIKMIDFATVLYITAVLIAVFFENRRKQKETGTSKE